MKRYSRTVAQQCRYYEVNNIFEYMVETYLNGNITTLENFTGNCVKRREKILSTFFSVR